MIMDAQNTQLLERLLEIDLDALSALIAGAEREKHLTDNEATALLNYAEKLSHSAEPEDKQICLLIAGLIWEHKNPEWLAVPAFLSTILTRIGLSPALMLINYDKGTGKYQSLGSLNLEASAAAHFISKNVKVSSELEILLTDFQYEAWNKIGEHSRIGISAPTSAGKSYALVYKTINTLIAGGTAIYIVPTISLINQVHRDLKKAAKDAGLQNLKIHQTYNPNIFNETNSNIYVLTQERASAILEDPRPIESLKLVVIDEIQNIERTANEDSDRAHILYDVTRTFSSLGDKVKVVISGPKIANIEQLTRELFGENYVTVSANLPPVVNMSYSFSKEKKHVILKQHTIIGQTTKAIKKPVAFDKALNTFNKRQYRDKVNDAIFSLSEKLGKTGSTLIFSPTSPQAAKTATYIAGELSGAPSQTQASLAEYIEESIHPNYSLRGCVLKGVGYHHGKMPHHMRTCIEKAFSNRDINILTSTTTLMQGVNLPAKNIIALNPDLFCKKDSNKENISLTGYEFANLRGRAGRLLKDFVGRTIVFDEKSFLDQNIDFSLPEKNITPGYKERFEKNYSQISEALSDAREVDNSHNAPDLVTYIRQVILRYGDDAKENLKSTGIVISDKEYAFYAHNIDKLNIPVQLCVANPYWDPVVLDKIYKANMAGKIPELPKTAFDPDYTGKMRRVINSIADITPYYHNKHLKTQNEDHLLSILINSQKWACEETLSSIINWRGHDLTTKEIDDNINLINQSVCYQLPKIIRPLVTMQNPNSGIIGTLETGVINQTPKRLVEAGISREVAIKLNKFIESSALNPIALERDLPRVVLSFSRHLNAWESSQVQDIFSA